MSGHRDPIGLAAIDDDVAVARRVIYRRLVRWTVLLLVTAGLVAGALAKYHAVTSWKNTIRSNGVRAAALVISVVDDTAKYPDDRVLLAVTGASEFRVWMHNVDVDRYYGGQKLQVWFTPRHHDQIATAWETNSQIGEVLWRFIALFATIAALAAGWVATHAARAAGLLRRGAAGRAEIIGAAIPRAAIGRRTVLLFDDSAEPWAVRGVESGSGDEVTYVGSSRHRVVCGPRPFVVRRAWTGLAREHWRHAVQRSREIELAEDGGDE